MAVQSRFTRTLVSTWLVTCAACTAQPHLQPLRSNETCTFVVNGQTISTGRSAQVELSNAEHEISCQAEGYRPKTTRVSPPFLKVPVTFTFMIEDKVDRPLTWEEVQQARDADLQLAREKYKLQIIALDYDPHSRDGTVTVAKATLEDRARIQTYVEEICQSKNKLIIVGAEDKEGAGYLVLREQAAPGSYSMWFRCVQ